MSKDKKKINAVNNPWAGLAAYQDPETCSVPLKFCGRNNDSYDVADLIDNNIFVTLYGKSGTGKTSLLNAGVFPLLRKSYYLPISIRLGTEDSNISFQHCILTEIEQAVSRKGRIMTIDVVPLNDDETSTEYLWRYFARTQFLDHDGRVVFPVLVLDQFEEVLRSRPKDVAVLLRQIYYLMDESHALSDRVIDGKCYSYDFNFRFVVAIREDDLYRLEDCIDNHYLVNMKHGRYRLRHLSNEGIRDVILIPGGDLFLEHEKDAIVQTIIDNVDKNHEEGGVSTNLLSLVCSRLFIKAQEAGMSHITLDLVDKFVKGNPYEKFYHQATKALSNRERLYIEQNLVDSENRRDSVSVKDFEKHVKNADYLFEGEYRILQKVSSSSGGIRVELIHDSFAEHLGTLKKKREKTRKLKFWATVATITLLYAVAGAYLLKQKNIIASQEIQIFNSKTELSSTKDTVNSQKKDIDEKNKYLQKWANDLKNLKDSVGNAIAELNKKKIELNKKKIELKKKDIEINEKDRKITEKTEEAEKSNAEKEKIENKNIILQQEVDRLTEQKNMIPNIGQDAPVFVIDSIEYRSIDSINTQINRWRTKHDSICKKKIEKIVNKSIYHIPTDMIELDPCLVYLVLNSKSIDDRKDKQEWFDLYQLMNEEQVLRLYDILLRERYKLAEIEDRTKQDKINHKELGL